MTTAAKYRRQLAALSLVLAVSPVLAIIPLGFGLGLVTGFAENSLILPVIGSTLVIGSIIGLISGHDSTQAPTLKNRVITAMLNPKIEVPNRPAGWKDPIPSIPSQPIPGDVAKTKLWKVQTKTGTVPNDVCDQYVKSIFPAGYFGTYLAPGTCQARNSSGGLVYSYAESFTEDCPDGSGWNDSVGMCQFSAPGKQKPSDGHCTIVRDGNTFSADPYDLADCSAASTAGNMSVTSTKATIDKKDGNTIETTINPDGSATITTTTTSNGQTHVSVVNVTAPNAATGNTTVTGQAGDTYQGTGDATDETPNENISFDKTGLATEGTQSAIKGVLDSIDNSLKPGAGNDSSLQTQKDALDTAMDSFADLFGGTSTTGDHGLTWDWFPSIPSSGACTNPSINIKGETLTIDFCTAAGIAREALSWLVYIFGSLMILNILTGKKEA